MMMAAHMKTLIQGCEKPAQFDKLIAMTRITSVPTCNALRAHLVDGFPASRCYARFGISQQNFSRALQRVNAAAALAMDYVAGKSQ